MKLRWFLGGLLGAIGSFAQAQIVYRINGSVPTTLPANNVIVLPDPVNSDTLIHVYDSSGVDDSVATQLVIRGSYAGGRVKVQVASSAEPDVFGAPREPVTFISVGLRNFAGIRFEDSTNPNDTQLRDRAVVAVAVQGDITGDIDAGQIWRVDSLQSADGTFGGTISGDIIARSPNIPTVGIVSIGYVRAARLISGNVLAEVVDGFNTPSSIDRVIVQGVSNASGITGNIRASGAINLIASTGGIGMSATQRSSIVANGRVVRVRAGNERGALVDRPLMRSVESELATTAMPGSVQLRSDSAAVSAVSRSVPNLIAASLARSAFDRLSARPPAHRSSRSGYLPHVGNRAAHRLPAAVAPCLSSAPIPRSFQLAA